MQRRQFLKASCNVCILGAAGFAMPALNGCGPAKMAVYKTSVLNKQVQVPLGLFTTSALQIVRPEGWYYDIAVEKKVDNTYSAVLMQCTHQENQLVVTGSGFTCSLHGSQFDKDGNVRKGPAEERLQHYATTVYNNNLVINIPKTP